MSQVLLTVSNLKASKSKYYGYGTAFLHLAPSNFAALKTFQSHPMQVASNWNMCKHASRGCREACLNVSGHGHSQRVQNARIKKTVDFIQHPTDFVRRLNYEISAFKKKCLKEGIKPCVRLNATSDVLWEYHDIFKNHPDVQFYDYTKYPGRNTTLPNYHLTFSLSETNLNHAVHAIETNGLNVAVVFNSKVLPNEYKLGNKTYEV